MKILTEEQLIKYIERQVTCWAAEEYVSNFEESKETLEQRIDNLKSDFIHALEEEFYKWKSTNLNQKPKNKSET